MANKYGLFYGSGEKPLQIFEAGKMRQNGDHVYFFNGTEQVAGIKLGEGQSVKIISNDAEPISQPQSHSHSRPTGAWNWQ
jgi:hypothetical protein